MDRGFLKWAIRSKKHREDGVAREPLLERWLWYHDVAIATIQIGAILAAIGWGIWAGGSPIWIALGGSAVFALVAARLILK